MLIFRLLMATILLLGVSACGSVKALKFPEQQTFHAERPAPTSYQRKGDTVCMMAADWNDVQKKCKRAFRANDLLNNQAQAMNELNEKREE